VQLFIFRSMLSFSQLLKHNANSFCRISSLTAKLQEQSGLTTDFCARRSSANLRSPVIRKYVLKPSEALRLSRIERRKRFAAVLRHSLL